MRSRRCCFLIAKDLRGLRELRARSTVLRPCEAYLQPTRFDPCTRRVDRVIVAVREHMEDEEITFISLIRVKTFRSGKAHIDDHRILAAGDE